MALEPIANPMKERLFAGEAASGLRLVAIEKPGFSKSHAVLAINFGAVDHDFADAQGGGRVRLPDGVAHFLEHKMFEDEQGDITDRFAALGASCNAFTSFASTCYVFTASDHVAKCLELLLELTLVPWFTPASIAKEQGIIGQEIRMYRDDPGSRLMQNLLAALYARHPVRIPIVGTEESIAKIDPELLHRCHRTFYRPANMALALAGPLPAEAMQAAVDAVMGRLGVARGTRAARAAVVDPELAASDVEEAMDVSRVKLALGFKDGAVGGEARTRVRRELLSSIALDLLFGAASENHERLYRSGLIDDGFGYDYHAEDDFGFALFAADCDAPAELEAEIVGAIRRLQDGGAAAPDFERIRNKLLGRVVSLFDSLETVAHAFALAEFQGLRSFEVLDVLNDLKRGEIAERAREMFDCDRAARSRIVPRAPRSAARPAPTTPPER